MRTASDRKRGIQWTFTTSLEDLDFADDLALLSHRIQVGLKVNATKTKLIPIGTKHGDGVGCSGAEEVDEFTYLGNIVSRKGDTDEVIQAGFGKAREVFALLRPIWRSTALTTKTKLRVFGSNAKVMLLYVLKL